MIAPEELTLAFRPMHNGALVGIATAGGRSIAAVLHPLNEETGRHRWSIAGDWDATKPRPEGWVDDPAEGLSDATEALARELGITVTGWSVTE